MTDISKRTTESLVRRIAKQMNLDVQQHWDETWGLFKEIRCNGFSPHYCSDDRERVMLASGVFWKHAEEDGIHTWTWYIPRINKIGRSSHKDSGRAFVEAENKRIEAEAVQETKDD